MNLGEVAIPFSLFDETAKTGAKGLSVPPHAIQTYTWLTSGKVSLAATELLAATTSTKVLPWTHGSICTLDRATRETGHKHNNTTRTTAQTNNHTNEPSHPTLNNAQRWRDDGAYHHPRPG